MLSLFLYKNKNVLVFLLLIFLSVFSISTHSVSVEYMLGQAVYNALYPITWVGAELGSFVEGAVEELSLLRTQMESASRIAQLEKEVEELTISNDQLKDALNELVQEKLEYQYLHSVFGEKLLVAQVVMRDLSHDRLGLVINKGERHGLEENMPVIAFQSVDEGGKASVKLTVVGKLASLTYLHAKIIPILDPQCQIHAQVNVKDNTGSLLLEWVGKGKGFVQGRFTNDSTILLTHLPRALPVFVGNEVVTSGGQSIFPRGIKIGRIVEDISDSVGFMKEVLVMPYVEYVNLHRVWVIQKTIHPEIRYLMDAVK